MGRSGVEGIGCRQPCMTTRRNGWKWIRCFVLGLLTVGSLPLAATGQNESSASTPEVASPWQVSVRLGLTDFRPDIDSPGSLSTVSIERGLSERFTLGLEAGLGSVTQAGRCSVGTEVEFGCEKASLWPSVGAGARFQSFDLGPYIRHYLLGQLGGHGSDFVRYYDFGQGLSIQAMGDIAILIELRHRSGAADGVVYFFGLARALGAPAAASR